MSFNRYLDALPKGDRGESAIVGIPFDGTASFRPGSRFGPQAIRDASQSLETYSTFLDRDLHGRDYIDWGDLELAPGRVDLMLESVENVVNEVLAQELKPIILGGEHTATLGVVRSLLNKLPELVLVQLDAHADYKEDYMGDSLNHATVMRRIAELIPPERIFRIGTRSGTRKELSDAGVNVPVEESFNPRDLEGINRNIPHDLPVYVTLDLDVFDPSLMPGVGNPEPNGLTWREFIQFSRVMTYKNFVGFDVMELTPQFDPTGVSAIVAASAVRDLMLSLMQ